MVQGAISLLTLFRQTLKKEKQLCVFPYFPFLAPTITHYRSKLLIGDKCKEYCKGLYEECEVTTRTDKSYSELYCVHI